MSAAVGAFVAGIVTVIIVTLTSCGVPVGTREHGRRRDLVVALSKVLGRLGARRHSARGELRALSSLNLLEKCQITHDIIVYGPASVLLDFPCLFPGSLGGLDGLDAFALLRIGLFFVWKQSVK